MNLPDFRRLIRPITNKIFLLLGRAVLKAVENSEDTQKIQVLALAEETISDIERFQEYGFETYPFAEAQVFIGVLNGNRDHGIALCVHDRRYRPTDLSEGEVCIYTDEDATTEFRLWLKRNRIAYLRADKSQEEIDTLKYVNCQEITLGSDTRAAVRKLIDERFKGLFNGHIHTQANDSDGNAQADTSVPTTLIVDADHMTDYTRAL